MHAINDDPIEGNLNELSFAGKTREWRPRPVGQLPCATAAAANSAVGKTSKRERNRRGRCGSWMDGWMDGWMDREACKIQL